MDDDLPPLRPLVRYPAEIPRGRADLLKELFKEDAPEPIQDILMGPELDTGPVFGPGPVGMALSLLDGHRQGIYPPIETLDWLACGFREWLDQGGRKSLEQCLGLKRPSGHAANELREFYRRKVVDSMLAKMLLLHCAFGIQINVAAGMVAAFMEDADWNKTGFEFKPLSDDTLLAYWADSKWTKDEWLRDQRSRFYADEDERKRLLSTFPRHCWEHLPELNAYL